LAPWDQEQTKEKTQDEQRKQLLKARYETKTTKRTEKTQKAQTIHLLTPFTNPQVTLSERRFASVSVRQRRRPEPAVMQPLSRAYHGDPSSEITGKKSVKSESIHEDC
jgi:hypothetical protein